MKLRVKILIALVIIIAVSVSIPYALIVTKGKAILIQRLKALTRKEVTIGYFGAAFPLNLEVRDIIIPDIVKIDSVSVSPGIFSLISRRPVLKEIKVVNPEFIYEKLKPPAAPQPSEEAVQMPAPEATSLVQQAPSVAPQAAPDRGKPLYLVIKRLKISGGKVNFIDHAVGEQPLKLLIRDISFNLTNLHLAPYSAITNFEIKGKIPWEAGTEEGKIDVSGWLNLFKKDIQATLKVVDIDGIAFYPYYSSWVDLEKARIEKAKLSFTSDIQGLNNDVTAQCRLELTDIIFKPRGPEEQQEKAEKIAFAVLDIFRALNQGSVVLNFNIKTKMDRPEFNFSQIRTAFEQKLSEGRRGEGFKPQVVLTLPSKLIEGTVKGATDITKAVITGTVSLGKELKDALGSSFKREPAESQSEDGESQPEVKPEPAQPAETKQ